MVEAIKKSLLITLEFPPQHGGVASFYYHACKNLPSNKVVVLAPQVPQTDSFDTQQKFTIIRSQKLSELATPQAKKSKLASRLKWLSLTKDIRAIIKEHKIEIIQVGHILPLGTIALILNQRQKLPYIVYAHGLDILLPQKFPRKKILAKKILKTAHGVIANSHFTKDEIVKLDIESQKIIVVNPCPNIDSQTVSDWKINEIKKDYVLKNEKIILTVGRLVERKGQDMVIKALPQVLKQVPNLIYLIIGSGPNQQQLENLRDKTGLHDHVKILNNIANEELSAFYSLCDVMAMPSRQIGPDVEGFGINYLEANLFGKPVIGSRSGGVPEAVLDRQTGLLVDPQSVEQITQALILLLTDEALAQRLGMQGMDRVINEFNWETQVEKIKQLLI